MRPPPPSPPVSVMIDSGEELASALYEATIELAPNFNRPFPVRRELLPRRQWDYLVAISQLALRRLGMKVEARRGGAQGMPVRHVGKMGQGA